MDSDLVVFDEQSARRIAAMVRRIEFLERTVEELMATRHRDGHREVFDCVLTGTLSGTKPDRKATGNIIELNPNGTWRVVRTGVDLYDEYGQLEGGSGSIGTFRVRGNRRVLLTLTCA